MKMSYHGAGPRVAPAGTAIPVGDQADSVKPVLPRWMYRLSAVAILLALAALSFGLLLFSEIVEGRIAEPAALSLAVLALVCGVAAVAARAVHASFTGRLELLSQALES